MPIVTVYDQTKKKVSDLNLDDRVFKATVRSHLVYDAVVAHGVNKRRGTASTKPKRLVRGGGAKPFRQKGTGRARQGSIRSSIQVGGGTAFGPLPKTYVNRFSKKGQLGAMRSVLTQLCTEKKIVVLKELKLEKIGTKKLIKILDNFSLEKGLIVDQENKNIQKSASNLERFKYLRPEGVNVYDLLKFQNLFVTEAAILSLEKRLQP